MRVYPFSPSPPFSFNYLQRFGKLMPFCSLPFLLFPNFTRKDTHSELPTDQTLPFFFFEKCALKFQFASSSSLTPSPPSFSLFMAAGKLGDLVPASPETREEFSLPLLSPYVFAGKRFPFRPFFFFSPHVWEQVPQSLSVPGGGRPGCFRFADGSDAAGSLPLALFPFFLFPQSSNKL